MLSFLSLHPLTLIMKLLLALAYSSTASILRVAAISPRNGEYRGGNNNVHCHDESFIPDHVLRLTYEHVSIGCQTRPSVLVNGSLPGPQVRLISGTTSWIRVYNDMTAYNATVVS